MKCAQCKTEGRKSKIFVPQFSTTTLMMPAADYYDEDGVFHKSKSPNTVTSDWTCSNGHKWRVTGDKIDAIASI